MGILYKQPLQNPLTVHDLKKCDTKQKLLKLLKDDTGKDFTLGSSIANIYHDDVEFLNLSFRVQAEFGLDRDALNFFDDIEIKKTSIGQLVFQVWYVIDFICADIDFKR